MRPLFVSAVLCTTVACKPPPDAPDALEDLASYIYHHTGNEDVAYVQAGLENLEVWLDGNLAEAVEGYTIYNLADEAVDSLDGTDRSVDDLIGAAVASTSTYDVDTLAEAIIMGDFSEISPGSYEVYERTFDGDRSCFISRECDRIDAHTYSESKWAGLVEIITENEIQFRWVETEMGWMMIQRNWLAYEAIGSCCDIVVHDMYFLSILLPYNSVSNRLQATWFDVDYGILPITEDAAKNLIVKSMSGSAEDLEVWLDEN